MSKQNRKTFDWILAFFFSVINVVSVFLPFVSARDILEPAHYMVFRTINLQELSIWGAGIVIAPILYVAVLLCALPTRDKVWLWTFIIVLQNFSFVGTGIDTKLWLSANTTDIERNIGFAVYIVSALFAAAFVFLALCKEINNKEFLSLPADPNSN